MFSGIWESYWEMEQGFSFGERCGRTILEEAFLQNLKW